MMLRDMAKPQRLFSLMSLGADTRAAADAAIRAFERWHGVISEIGDGKYRVVWEQGRRLSQRLMDPAKLLRSKYWRDWQASMTSCESFSATLAGEARPAMGMVGESATDMRAMTYRNSGFSVDLADGSGEAVAPQLLLWADVEGMPPERATEIEGALREITDEAMVAADGKQAFMARWLYPPHRPAAGATLYEMACGIHQGAGRL